MVQIRKSDFSLQFCLSDLPDYGGIDGAMNILIIFSGNAALAQG